MANSSHHHLESPGVARRHNLVALLLITTAVSLVYSIISTREFDFIDDYIAALHGENPLEKFRKPENRPLHRLSYFGRIGVNSATAAVGSSHRPNNMDNDDDYEARRKRQTEEQLELLRRRRADFFARKNNISTAERFFQHFPNSEFTGKCERVAGDEFLAREWRKKSRVACRANVSQNPAGWTAVTEHLLEHLDAKPSLRVYDNVMMKTFVGPVLGTGCPGDTHLTNEDGTDFTPEWVAKFVSPEELLKRNNRSEIILFGFSPTESSSSLRNNNHNRPGDDEGVVLVRLLRFAPGNPFEAFHAYINSYLMIRALQLDQTKVRFVFQDTLESTVRDDEFWNSFSLNKQRPIYRYTGKDNLGGRRKSPRSNQFVFARRVIQGFSTGISVLVSSAAPLGGRGQRHRCASSLLQNATRWMRRNFELIGRLPSPKPEISPRASSGGRIEVIWCSRSVHPRAGGRLIIPSRVLARETQFVLALREALGPDVHLRVVDFSKLNGPESIRAAETAQVMIGFHGAGMTWGMFMRPGHSAVIELFGDDRSHDNFHYANICSLQMFAYAEYGGRRRWHYDPYSWENWPVEGKKGKALVWHMDDVTQLADIFHGQLPWAPRAKPRKPCY